MLSTKPFIARLPLNFGSLAAHGSRFFDFRQASAHQQPDEHAAGDRQRLLDSVQNSIGHLIAVASLPYAHYDETQKQFAGRILSTARNEAGKLDVNADTLHGRHAARANRHPATEILDTAAARDCDLIIMASHGRRGNQRLILGNQAAEVAAHSHAAILVVRRCRRLSEIRLRHPLSFADCHLAAWSERFAARPQNADPCATQDGGEEGVDA
jgi:nucleotide-binding universal stress UspA family protein